MSNKINSVSEERGDEGMDSNYNDVQNILDHSTSNSGKESNDMGVNSKKRKRVIACKDDRVSKRPRNEEDSEFPSDLQNESRQDLYVELHNACLITEYRNHFPHRLIGLAYQLDLSVLCSLRKFTYEHKYPSLSLAFGDHESDEFNNIVLRYKNKSIYIQIENVDKCYIDNDISYDRLFNKEKRKFSINNYFNSFIKHIISKLDGSFKNIEYLIIYTNSGLNLTEEKELKQGRYRHFYPFKFASINIEEYDILKDFLFTNDNTKGRDFYHFLQDKTTRKEISKRLDFSSVAQKVIKERKVSQEEIKDFFLDKLLFAVNQPNREELNRIIKNEIEKSKVQNDYIEFQEKILHDLTAPEKQKKGVKLVNYIPATIYELNLLMIFLHDMFLHKNIFSINSKRKSQDISNDVTIHYKDKITYVKAHTTDNNIGYVQLFCSRKREEQTTFNKHFTLFVEELRKDIKYFIIYTNANLDLTVKNKLKQGCSKDFYPVEFNSIDIRKRKYKILREFSCINENGLYQFAQEETTRKKLLSLLKLPPSLQKVKDDGKLSNENETEIKETFLDKIIFAVNQPNKEELYSTIKNKIENNNKSNIVPYNYKELHEIALRWSESHEFRPITKGIMEKIFEDIKNNRFSYQKNLNKDINEEMKFAKSVVGREGTPAFDEFLDFLIKGEILEILKRREINLHNMSSILNRAGTNAEKAFKDLYNLWFDKQGNKTRYLKTLEEKGISLANMSSILGRAGVNAAKAFKDLYDLWFDKEGNKTRYLKTIEGEGISLSNMSSILGGGRANAPTAFKDLYDLWFDKQGNKTQYLQTLEKEGINLTNMSSILNGAGANAAKAFTELYNTFFDAQGSKTPYLKTLEEEGANLANMSSILNGVGANASKAFKDLYDLWFDKQGSKTQYLKTLEKEGIKLANVSSILSRAGTKAPKAFINLYDLWFDKQGHKTQYLTTLEKEGINLTNMSSMLHGAGAYAAEAFKELYDLWFDEEGNRTEYLKTLEKEGVNLANMSSILHGARANAAKTFKDVYDLWFDKHGSKTQYLKTLEKEGINLTNMSSILGGAGTKAPKAFKTLYDLWFDKQGNKTKYLKTLEKEGINLTNMSSISHGAGAFAAEAFKDLYDVWFDGEGNKTRYLNTIEKEGMDLINISSILNGAGANAAKTLIELYNTFFDEQGNKKPHLKHFIKRQGEERGFKLRNLSGILGGAGTNAKDAFKKFHNVCFDDKGERTELLCDFYKAGFKPRNLSSILCGAGVRASSILKKLHSVCFYENREKTKLLDAFYKAGFRPSDLCSILSGAADSLEKFHDFCFIGETKEYLSRFLAETESFTMTNLSEILHGAKTNICSALKDFHDVCFNETGSKQLLNDLYNARFTSSDLSSILSMAGNNAASNLRVFHKSCFNKKKYLKHFLAEKELFTPKILSKILHRVGINICPIFEKLHDLCFDQAGNKTNFLNNLMKNDQNEALYRLCKKVGKTPAILS